MSRALAPDWLPVDDTPGDALERADALARRLATTAVARDRAGGHAATEREWVRESGLLRLSVPAVFGGEGAGWRTVMKCVRRIAQADSALAHVFAFHHLQMATVLMYGAPTQQRTLLTETVEQNLFWGNALNPLDRRAVATEAEPQYRVDGAKSFCSGAVGSDRLVISAWHDATQTALVATVPTRRQGIAVKGDWDAFGQRQTDSGSVTFDRVALHPEEVLVPPGAGMSPSMTLRSQVAQLIMANLYLGVGQGAFEEARRYTAQEARAWGASGVARAVDDPLVQLRYGELAVLLRPAELAADAAGQAMDAAVARGRHLTAAERGEVAIAVAGAKVLAHRAGLEVSSTMFEQMGARATSGRLGLDRFWRNVRVHTLHDPVDYKLRDLGRHALDGRHPEPGPYA